MSTICKPVVSCIIDSHMHIQSGACAPLPLVYNQLASKIKFNPKQTPGLRSRSWIDGIGTIVLGDGGKLQILDSMKICDRSIKDCSDTYLNLKNSYFFCKPDITDISITPAVADATDIQTVFIEDNGKPLRLSSGKPYRIVIKKTDDFVFSQMIAMPMDMEYAHIAGYNGQTIYHEENGELFYYHRKSGIDIEELGEKIDLSHEIEKKKKTLKLKKWKTQKFEYERSACNYPLQLIPMYHYEPRRWRMDSDDKTDTVNFDFGGWEYPFRQIVTESKAGLFIGFKMYTPLGYRPLDEKLSQMSNYYAKCEKEKIPILNHCSPGGMLTHEQPFYKDYIEKGYKHFPEKKSDGSIFAPDASSVYISQVHNNSSVISEPSPTVKTPEEEIQLSNEWFLENYVHPKAWRKVLDKFPNLYLCLAHFGGDDWEFGPAESDWIKEIIDMLTEKDSTGKPVYPNLFTDIACFAIEKNMPQFITAMKEHPELWDKVLFGTDWYMTLIVSESGQQQYGDFCRKMKEELDNIDESIWIRFTFLNSVRFYGLDNPVKLNKMYSAIKDKMLSFGIKTDILESTSKKLKEAIDKIESIKKSI